MIMKKIYPFLLILAVIAVMCLSTAWQQAYAAYKVHKVTGKVALVRGGKPVEIKTGMELTAKDMVEISNGGYLEILNTADSKIYCGGKPGKKSIAGFIFQAKAKASDNVGNVNRHFNGGMQSKKAVYSEKGRVTREIGVAECDSLCDSLRIVPDLSLPGCDSISK